MTAIKVFLSHSNELDDQQLVFDEILPKLEVFEDLNILTQDELKPGQIFLSSLTELVDKVDKTLLFITKNAMQSSWCNLELLIGLERSQRKQQLSVVLLLHDIEEKDIPQIAVLQEARKIIFTKENDSWVTETVERIREKETIKQLMPAGNVAHGLVWSHYAGLLQYILPDLENNLKESEWYKNQLPSLQNHVSTKFYEMVPTSCTCHFDCQKWMKISNWSKFWNFPIQLEGETLENLLSNFTVLLMTYFCICEYPSAIGAMKAMEDHHLAKFSIDDKKLQLARFYYTMNSVINHFDISRNKARVVLFNDETEKVSEVLVKAIKQDLQLTEKVMPKESPIRPKLEDLEPTPELEYQYQVYIAHSEDTEDKQSAKEIIEYLEQKGIHSILKNPDSPNDPDVKSNTLIKAVQNCRWFIFLMTQNSVKDKMLQLRVLAALHDGILKRRVRVIPVVDRRNDIYIPDALQWVTYVPYNGQTKSHLKSLHNIVSGEDFPLKTEMLLPAGDVANGLAWGYVVNYLRVILPDALKNIEQSFKKKNISDYKCPETLFIIIPKSCDAKGVMKDKNDRISSFTTTPDIHPFGGGRSFSCQIYQITDQPDKYFIGQYAAPITCLHEMKEWRIAGVTADTILSEAYSFYEIVKNLMESADPQKAKCCEFIYFDDEKDSLADIIEKRIG
ncbi:Hypothetical predicted protein [Mytilus galloprovincialis]|uniref:TIR domain-containing protein n=1 Tax=Mytilus galloprovincialis TaxID=29158 RepID=A0A8B6DYR7_MYTGA|nr:Hypothetical predicted protein [Mytilus galloprovincialis]